MRIRIRPGERDRYGQPYGRPVIEYLEAQAHITAGVLAGDVALDLTTGFRRVAHILRALTVTIEPADMEHPLIVERFAIVEIQPRTVEINTPGQAEVAARNLACLTYEVEDPAGRVTRESSRTAAADHLQSSDVVIRPDEGIGGREFDDAEIQHRKSILLELREFGSAADWQPARSNVSVALPARGLRKNPRDVAQHVCCVGRRRLLYPFRIKHAHRQTGSKFGARCSRYCDDGFLQRERITSRKLSLGRRLREHRCRYRQGSRSSWQLQTA